MWLNYYGTGERNLATTEGAVTMVCGYSRNDWYLLWGFSEEAQGYNSDIKIIGSNPTCRHKNPGLKNMKESYRPGIFE